MLKKIKDNGSNFKIQAYDEMCDFLGGVSVIFY